MLPAGKDLGRYATLGQVGFEMVVPIAVGLVVDNYLGWQPWGVTAGTILGFSGGLLHLVLVVNKLNKTEQNDDSSGPKSEAK